MHYHPYFYAWLISSLFCPLLEILAPLFCRLSGLSPRKIRQPRQPTYDRVILSNWSHNLHESDQKVIQPSYDGNIILTWYMIYRERISRPRRANIDSRRFSNICQAVSYRSRGRRTFFRFSVTPAARYQKSLIARWRTYPADEKLSSRRERVKRRDKARARFFRVEQRARYIGLA